MSDCGVYKITCAVSGKVYIGSSIGMAKRFGEHRSSLRYGRHHSLLLQRAWNKYGEGAFEFEKIIVCSPEARHFYEQRAIDAYDAANPKVGMNRSAIAVGSPPNAAFKGRKHSDASKALMSARLKGRSVWNKGIPSTRKGVPRSEADKAKITAARRNSHTAIITIEIAREIRMRHANGELNQRKLAVDMSLSYNVVNRVLRNISWVEAA